MRLRTKQHIIFDVYKGGGRGGAPGSNDCTLSFHMSVPVFVTCHNFDDDPPDRVRSGGIDVILGNLIASGEKYAAGASKAVQSPQIACLRDP